MNIIFSLLICLASTQLFAKIDKVFDSKMNEYIEFDTLLESISRSSYVVLGEFHNNDAIQSAQGKIIQDLVQKRNLFGNFNVGWEFLNYSDQDKITRLFRKVLNNQIQIKEFLEKTAGKQNLSYTPMIQSIKNKVGKLTALNVSRAIKQKLINEGEDAIKEHLPPNYVVGGELYRDRFYKAMGSHVPEDMKEPYFKAQCLTDSMMSYRSVESHTSPLTFIIAGSFHTDFYQGTISRLKKITSDIISTLKIVDSTLLTKVELEEIIKGDPIHGRYADFIVITSP